VYFVRDSVCFSIICVAVHSGGNDDMRKKESRRSEEQTAKQK
jgi:hypothetical protein